jgi:hypothetical protein
MMLEPQIEQRIRRDICFSDAKGVVKAKLERESRKLLAKAAPLLRRVLEEDEEIHGITIAGSPFSVLEYLTTGWILMLLKRCLLVVTDRRLLHLPTRADQALKGSVAEVRFADLAEIKFTGFGTSLRLRYKSGQKEDFNQLPRAARRKLQQLLPPRAGTGAASGAPARRFLCPRCARALAPGQSQCCDLRFKEKGKAARYSLLLPGGGYFYTGHPIMGTIDALVELGLILGLVVALAGGLQGEADAWPAVVLISVLLALEKLISVYHARHFTSEFLPEDRRVVLR